MRATFRPLPTWPYPPTENRRSRWTFKATYSETLELLEREVSWLDGSEVIVGAGFRERDIRLDGMIRADAREPLHPGVEVSFDTPQGRLVYATDVCELWQHNVRSIALGLDALRAVDRYGITHQREQYAGFLKLGPGGPDAERGHELVVRAGGIRQALMQYHPDHGGDARDFADVQAFRDRVGDR